MKNKQTAAILNEVAKDDEFNFKICLIEDVCKAKKLLWALGDKQHDEFISAEDSARLFDYLYDLHPVSLQTTLKGYSDRINELMVLKMEAIS